MNTFDTALVEEMKAWAQRVGYTPTTPVSDKVAAPTALDASSKPMTLRERYEASKKNSER
jgi:hypothetical protein